MGFTDFDKVRANLVQADQFIGASMVTQGNIWYVRPGTGSDTLDGTSPSTAFATLAKALAKATANQNDVVYLMAESNTAADTTDYQATALDWNKDGVHIIGIGSAPMIGQRSRIAQLSTVKTIEDLFTVSADNCLIANIEVFHGVASGTQTAGRAMVVSGQRNRIVNCQISGIGDSSFDDAGARSLAVTGAENTFQHCYIGLDTVIRATAQAEVTVGDVARTIFEDCFFNTYTSADGFLMVKYSAPDRFILFKNCTFSAINNITSATAPAAALSAGTSVNGQIMIQGSSFFGFDNVIASTDAKVLMSSFAAGVGVDQGLGGSTTIS
jgi:hypothetical protein